MIMVIERGIETSEMVMLGLAAVDLLLMLVIVVVEIIEMLGVVIVMEIAAYVSSCNTNVILKSRWQIKKF